MIALSESKEIADKRKLYKSGVSDSVLEVYKQYLK